MPKDFWRWCRLWQVMNNDTKCSSWLRKRPTGQKQSRGEFACCKITSEAGRSNATLADHHGPVHADIPGWVERVSLPAHPVAMIGSSARRLSVAGIKTTARPALPLQISTQV